MKELLLIGTVVATITTGSITAGNAHSYTSIQNTPGGHTSVSMIHKAELQAEAKAETIRKMKLRQNAEDIASAVRKLKKYVGKTSYVFSGHTPSGWDCSGLTMWFYEQLGISLDHSASKQAKYAGVHVDSPVAGDIVAFKHVNSEKYYHVGIYVGDNKVIHAKKPGTRTEMIELTDGWFAQSEISFIRVIESK